MKTCPRCGDEKPLSLFAGRSYCRPCVNDYQRLWRQKNKPKTHWYGRKGQLRRLYGITPEQYDSLLIAQAGRCAICRSPSPGDDSRYFHVDHDHDTGKVRGLLCGLCNKGLGCFNDSAKRLTLAIHYLKEKA